jgi:hypothetical protein
MTAPAGWYPDPMRPDLVRWWDGVAWSEHAVRQPWTPPAPAPRRKLWPWLLGGGLGMLVILGGCALVITGVVISITEPIGAANEYLSDVRDGRTAEAYDQLCGELRRTLTFEGYLLEQRERQEQAGELVSFDAYGSATESGRGAIVDITIRTTRLETEVEAHMVEEDGDWRWCGARSAVGGISESPIL